MAVVIQRWELSGDFCVSGDQHWWEYWCLYSLIVVWVDTHFILLRVEGVFAQLHRPQLVVGLQVGPAPQTAVDDVGQTFSVGNLKTAIQRSRYSDAFRVDILGGDGFLQFVQLSRLLQLLHQALHRFFTPLLLLAVLLSLLPAQKSFDNGGSERQN